MTALSLNAVPLGTLTLTAAGKLLELSTPSVIGLTLGIAVPVTPGEINTGANVGTGEGVFKEKSGVELRFKSITGSGGVVVTSTADEVDIDATGAALDVKSGFELVGAFAGAPLKATVTFTSAFPDTSYSVTFDVVTDGSRSYAPSIESKTVNGFVINLQSNSSAGLAQVGWQAIANGEV